MKKNNIAVFISLFVFMFTNQMAFSNNASTQQYYFLNPNFNSSTLEIMSLENNNQIQMGARTFTLNEFQRSVVTDTAALQGTVISGTGAFTLGSESNATDLPVPASFAGTQFAIAHQRGDHTYYLYSLHGDSNVQIQVGNLAAVNVTLAANQVTEFSAGNAIDVVGRIQSDKPILVAHKAFFDTQSEDSDAYPVPPANTELWGISAIFNNFAAMEDNTTLTIEDSNGNTRSLVIANAGVFSTLDTATGVNQGQGVGLHITADKPVAVTATADRDGFETTAFLGKGHLANRYGVPIDAQYITIVCPEPGSSITLHALGNDPLTQSCVSSGDFVSKAYFDNTTTPIVKGSFIESNKPVFVALESLVSDDEQNLLGARSVPSNNILVIIADDLGMDILESFRIEGLSAADEASLDRAPTPNLDRLLIDKGVKFTNVMANPVCSPTRASIQTGRYGIRTGVRWASFEGNGQALPTDETTIPELLNRRGYAHAAIGKWHLSDSTSGGTDGPRAAGYSHHEGSERNIFDFFNWTKLVNGAEVLETTYAPTVNVDDALNWLGQQDTNKPWFIWFAFNTPHAPWQVPPLSANPGPHQAVLTGAPGDSNSVTDTDPILYRAMVEYMDEEIGRLINGIPPEELAETTIFFMGDNGTPAPVTVGIDPAHAKFTVYQQGIHVPMIVAGAGVSDPGRTSNQLINSTDLFSTILELAGIDISVDSNQPALITDSISFLPILQNVPTEKTRQYAFSETVNPGGFRAENNGITIRDNRFKLIRFLESGNEEFYDLQNDVLETNDLLLTPLDANLTNKYNELLLELNKIVAP